MTQTIWYCNRCGNRIEDNNNSCPNCSKILYWIKEGWFFPSYFPKGIDAMTKQESKVLRIKWDKNIEDKYRKKGMLSLMKYKIFGEEKADRRRRRATTEEMAVVFDKYGTKCIECGSNHKMTVDHIIPLAKGGTWEIDNLRPLCQSCNSKKGTKDE